MAQDPLLERLQAVETRLERIELLLTRLEGLQTSAQGLLAMGVDVVDRAAAKHPVELEARLHASLALLERLSRPESVALLAKAIELAAQLPAGLAMLTDSFDQLAQRLAAQGINLEDRVMVGLRVVERLTAPELLRPLEQALSHHEALHRILTSGAFEPEALDVVGRVAESLAAAAKDPRPVGLWGALRAAGTSPVQHALGFALALASGFGETLAKAGRPAALTAGASK